MDQQPDRNNDPPIDGEPEYYDIGNLNAPTVTFSAAELDRLEPLDAIGSKRSKDDATFNRVEAFKRAGLDPKHKASRTWRRPGLRTLAAAIVAAVSVPGFLIGPRIATVLESGVLLTATPMVQPASANPLSSRLNIEELKKDPRFIEFIQEQVEQRLAQIPPSGVKAQPLPIPPDVLPSRSVAPPPPAVTNQPEVTPVTQRTPEVRAAIQRPAPPKGEVPDNYVYTSSPKTPPVAPATTQRKVSLEKDIDLDVPHPKIDGYTIRQIKCMSAKKGSPDVEKFCTAP